MKPDTITTLIQKLEPFAKFGQQHMIVLIVIAFGGIYAYLLLQIGDITSQSPSDAAITKELKTIPRPKIDEQAVSTIESLQDQNINIQAITNEARDNPFNE